MAFIVGERQRHSITFVDEANPRQKRVVSSAAPLHYEDAGGNYQPIDMTPVRVNNAQLDGWRVTSNGWHYALGRPGDKTTDGWVGFGGRQGQHWVKMRLLRVGYFNNPSSTPVLNENVFDIGGAPTYTRTGRLSFTPAPKTIEGVAYTCEATAQWSGIWSTPGGGSLDLRWRLDGGRLKQDVLINQAGREWIAANRPPAFYGLDGSVFFGFAFEVDWSDIPKRVINGVLRGADDDFSDDDGRIELRTALDELLAFLPADYAYVDVPASEGQRARRHYLKLRKRFWHDGDGNHYLMIGAPVSDLAALPAGDIVFDPTVQVAETAHDAHAEDFVSGWREHTTPATTPWGTQYLADGTSAQGAFIFETTVPQGATIDSSSLSFQGVDSSGTVNGAWQGYDEDEVADFSDSHTHPMSSHAALTSASVTHNFTATTGTITTPSLNTVLQEIVDRPGFTGKIGVVYVPTGGGYQGFVDYSDSAANAATLDVTYTASAATLDQSAYRWRNDDGSESGATWKASENTPVSVVQGNSARLRVQANAASNPDPAQFRLESRRLAQTALEDNFNDNSQDTAKWSKEAYHDTNQSVTVVEANGVLEITPLTSTTGENYNGYLSVNDFDFTGMYCQVEITQVAQNFAVNELLITLGTNNAAGFDIEDDTLYFLTAVNGSYESTNITYNATDHRYLRLRHEPSDDTFRWETSPDGSTWTQRRSLARNFDITAVKFQILSGTYQSTASPGSMIADNFIAGYLETSWAAVSGSTEISLSDSANIAASAATSTTAQLTAPSGKTTGDFEAGRISDDTNPLPSLDLTDDAYTELEWCIAPDAGAFVGLDHEFRVTVNGTPFDTYTVTPTLTVIETGDVNGAGQSDAVLTTDADSAVDKERSGQADAVLTTDADSAVDKERSGQADAVLTTDADSAVDKERSGQADSSLITDADSAVDKERSGQADAVLTTTGEGTTDSALLRSGQSDAVLVTAGESAVDHERSGQSNAVLSTSGTAVIDGVLDGDGQSDAVLVTLAFAAVEHERSGQSDSVLTTFGNGAAEQPEDVLGQGSSQSTLTTFAMAAVDHAAAGSSSAVLTTFGSSVTVDFCGCTDEPFDIGHHGPFASLHDMDIIFRQLSGCRLGQLEQDDSEESLDIFNTAFPNGIWSSDCQNTYYARKPDGSLFISVAQGENWNHFVGPAYPGLVVPRQDPNDDSWALEPYRLPYAHDSVGSFWIQSFDGSWQPSFGGPTYLIAENTTGPDCDPSVLTLMTGMNVVDNAGVVYNSITGEIMILQTGWYLISHRIEFASGGTFSGTFKSQIRSPGGVLDEVWWSPHTSTSHERGVGGTQRLHLSSGDTFVHEALQTTAAVLTPSHISVALARLEV